MPYKKRKRYVRKLRTFKAMTDKLTAKHNVVVTMTTAYTASAGAQDFFCVFNGWGIPDATSNIQGAAVVNPIVNAWQHMSGKADSYAGLMDISTRKFQITNQVCNFNLTNYGTTTALIDVYRVVVHRTFNNSDFAGEEEDNTSDDTTLFKKMDTGFTTEVADTVSGITLFNSNIWPKYFKVLQVKEIQLPAGNTATMSFRIPKNYWITLKDLLGKVFIKGLTQGYIFRIRSVPATSGADLAASSIGVHREYSTTVREITPNVSTIYSGNVS